jgi:hypothetical protein
MKKRFFVLSLLLLTGLALSQAQAATAQDSDGDIPTRSELPAGIGMQYAAPAFGISGIYDFTDSISGQAVLGLFGGLQMYAGRGLYRFSQQEAYDLYGFGTVGIWQYSAGGASTSTTGFGGGAGLEYSWQQLLDNADVPPLFSNIEIGFVSLTDEFTGYNYSSFTYSAGIHYRF